MRVALIALVVCMPLSASSAPGGEIDPSGPTTPSQQLEQARIAFRAGQYVKARGLFNDLVYPPPPKLASAQQLTEVYLALGVCRYETGDTPNAKLEFEQALQIDPSIRLDPMIVSDPKAIDLFNQTRLDIQDKLKAEADAKQRANYIKIRESMQGYESHQRILNFVPFGFGQHQNGETGKAAFFAATEGVTLITSFGIYAYLVNTYGLRSTHVPASDSSNVRFLQQVEIGSGALFIGLATYGIIDSLRHYKPTVRADIDESLLPPELRGLLKPATKPKPAKPPKTSILDHVTPIVTPNSVGVGLSWEQ